MRIAIAPTDELSRKGDRFYEGHCESAMSTISYANALTLEFSQKGDRTNKTRI
ncbi:MAG: hypothetical protein KME50_22865 [Nostoc desertorum CM1-VF14]|nr:hypothetical protein [Nostoc desertorum CM1-VF14]